MDVPARILVVEDDAASRDVLCRMLRAKGYETQDCADGSAAVRVLDECEDESHPQRSFDLVLLDVSMPGLSGLEVLEYVRRSQSADRLPVILVTAHGESSDVVAGLEAGANDYVTKPVNPPVLLARVEVAIRLKQGVARLVEAERHRVTLDALLESAHRLGGPIDEIIDALETAAPPDSVGGQRWSALLEQARSLAREITRLERLASYRGAPYSAGLGGFVTASLDPKRDDEPKTP